MLKVLGFAVYHSTRRYIPEDSGLEGYPGRPDGGVGHNAFLHAIGTSSFRIEKFNIDVCRHCEQWHIGDCETRVWQYGDILLAVMSTFLLAAAVSYIV